MSYFGISSGIALPQARVEQNNRDDVRDVEVDNNQDQPPAPNPAPEEQASSQQCVFRVV